MELIWPLTSEDKAAAPAWQWYTTAILPLTLSVTHKHRYRPTCKCIQIHEKRMQQNKHTHARHIPPAEQMFFLLHAFAWSHPQRTLNTSHRCCMYMIAVLYSPAGWFEVTKGREGEAPSFNSSSVSICKACVLEESHSGWRYTHICTRQFRRAYTQRPPD